MNRTNVILQCRIIQEVLNAYRNLMLEVKLEFGPDTSESEKLWHTGTHALGTIMAEVKGLKDEHKGMGTEDPSAGT